jgi:CHAT domain-containing protein
MKLHSTCAQLWFACFGVLALLLAGPSFASRSRHVPNAPAASGSSPVPAREVRPGENPHNADSSFAEAESLRTEQRAESNWRAIEKYKEAAEVWRAAGQFEKAATAFRNAGEISQLLGDTKSALSEYKESLALSKKAKSSLEESRVLNDLGYLHFIAGNTEEARQNCQWALRLGRALRNDAVVAQAISNIGETFFGFGDLTKALEYQQQALTIWRRLGDQRGQSQALVALVYYYSNLGEPAKARESYYQALSLSRGIHDLGGEVLALIADGHLTAKLGETQEALQAFEAARLLVERVGDRTSLARVVGGMGDLYFGVGDNQKALEHFLQAAKLFELGDEKWGIGESKWSLGRIYHTLGDDKRALEYLQEALALFKALSMSRLEALTLRDIGLVYSAIKDSKNAVSSYEKALKLTRAGQDQRYEAYTLNYLGRVYEDLKDYESAIAHYRRALPLNHIAGDQAGEVLTLYNIAHVERNRRNLAEAQRQIEGSTRIAESLRSNVSSQDLRASYFATVRQTYELYVDVLMQRHKISPSEGFAAKAFEISEKARARSFLESLHESQTNIREGVDPALLVRERALNETLNAKAERQMQLLASKDKVEAEKVANEINSLTIEYAEIRDQIKATSPRYAALTQPQPLTLQEVQQRVLDDDSLLLEYALGDERSYVWAVTRKDVSSFELPPRAEIETAARGVYELLVGYQALPGEPLEQRRQREAKTDDSLPAKTASLSKLLLGPVVGKLEHRRLIIVPDGALQYIPFQALTVPQMNLRDEPQSGSEWNQLLLKNHEVVNELSASTLGLLLNESAARKLAPNTVAVLADPVFEVDDPRVSRARGEVHEQTAASLEVREALRDMRDVGISPDGVQIPRLFASREEAESIMASTQWGTGLKFLDFDASREHVMGSELARYRIVHFATHGVINNEHPELSGIVLSLFDRQGNPQDGFLRLHDIYNLHLPADLVVLSACSSGLGRDVKGEGLIGLTRGFMYAGASGVVASLWKVDDDATAELMKYFYQAMFTKGLSPSAALRDSQLTLSQQKRWQAPYYWAGFVIQGQYNEKENFGRRSFLTGQRVAIVCVLAGLLLLASVFFLHRRRSRII